MIYKWKYKVYLNWWSGRGRFGNRRRHKRYTRRRQFFKYNTRTMNPATANMVPRTGKQKNRSTVICENQKNENGKQWTKLNSTKIVRKKCRLRSDAMEDDHGTVTSTMDMKRRRRNACELLCKSKLIAFTYNPDWYIQKPRWWWNNYYVLNWENSNCINIEYQTIINDLVDIFA